MRGLIWKDMINQKGQMVTYLFILVMWIVLAYFNENPVFFIGAMEMLALMIPLTSMAYDERSKWEVFAVTMPVTRQEIVVAKYLFALLVILAVAGLSVIGALILGGELEESLMTVLFSLPLGLGFNSVILPIIFRFGVEKGRFVFLGVMAAFLLAGFAAAKLPSFEILSLLSFVINNVWVVVALFWLVCLALAALSMSISIRVYSRKEF